MQDLMSLANTGNLNEDRKAIRDVMANKNAELREMLLHYSRPDSPKYFILQYRETGMCVTINKETREVRHATVKTAYRFSSVAEARPYAADIVNGKGEHPAVASLELAITRQLEINQTLIDAMNNLIAE